MDGTGPSYGPANPGQAAVTDAVQRYGGTEVHHLPRRVLSYGWMNSILYLLFVCSGLSKLRHPDKLGNFSRNRGW